eukprot:7383665-Prymnesium_polylepis.1
MLFLRLRALALLCADGRPRRRRHRTLLRLVPGRLGRDSGPCRAGCWHRLEARDEEAQAEVSSAAEAQRRGGIRSAQASRDQAAARPPWEQVPAQPPVGPCGEGARDDALVLVLGGAAGGVDEGVDGGEAHRVQQQLELRLGEASGLELLLEEGGAAPRARRVEQQRLRRACGEHPVGASRASCRRAGTRRGGGAEGWLEVAPPRRPSVRPPARPTKSRRPPRSRTPRPPPRGAGACSRLSRARGRRPRRGQRRPSGRPRAPPSCRAPRKRRSRGRHAGARARGRRHTRRGPAAAAG